MNIPRFWARAAKDTTSPRGSSITAQKWHWSDESEDDARRKAEDRLEIMLSRIHAGEPWPRRYDYGENMPLREERIREIDLPGTSAAIITRNAYGALVLNAEQVMFVDIDEDNEGKQEASPACSRDHGGEPPMFSVEWFIRLVMEKVFGSDKSLAGNTNPPPDMQPAPISQHHPKLHPAEQWVARHPDWGFRVYQTKSGYRLLATHALFQPDAPATLDAMRDLGCDPVYVRLCKNQKSFRARLTPKPWRLGGFHGWRRITSHTHKFPYSEAAKPDIMKWIHTYESASEKYATCRFLKTIGTAATLPAVAAVANVHDELTKAESGLPLA
jgi:hypothetical protein